MKQLVSECPESQLTQRERELMLGLNTEIIRLLRDDKISSSNHGFSHLSMIGLKPDREVAYSLNCDDSPYLSVRIKYIAIYLDAELNHEQTLIIAQNLKDEGINCPELTALLQLEESCEK